MKIAAYVSAALIVGAALAGPALADEARVSAKPIPAVSRQISQPQRVKPMEPIRVAMVDVAPQKRCDTMLCPMYVVLGSGF